SVIRIILRFYNNDLPEGEDYLFFGVMQQLLQQKEPTEASSGILGVVDKREMIQNSTTQATRGSLGCISNTLYEKGFAEADRLKLPSHALASRKTRGECACGPSGSFPPRSLLRCAVLPFGQVRGASSSTRCSGAGE